MKKQVKKSKDGNCRVEVLEKTDSFEALANRIQRTSDALQQDALVVINRSVTARAWLTGYYIVEYEQHGADRAKYGEHLLQKLSERLGSEKFEASCMSVGLNIGCTV